MFDFKEDNADLIAIREAAKHVPVIATVYLDVPAILTELRKSTAELLDNFGGTDEALLNVIVVRALPEGTVSSIRFASRTPVLALTPKRRAAPRRDWPDATSPYTRSRRSSECDFPMIHLLQR